MKDTVIKEVGIGRAEEILYYAFLLKIIVKQQEMSNGGGHWKSVIWAGLRNINTSGDSDTLHATNG